MKKFDFKKLVPHLVAIAIFLIVALLYCKPALEGKVLEQHDLVQWKAMSRDAQDYGVKHGKFPQWTNGIFSGMPSYQIAFNTNAKLGWMVPEIAGFFLPKPFLYFFLACICFYILSLALRLRTVLGIMGALAFAYATYNPVIVFVGHDTKMMSIAMMPAMLAGIFLIFDKKYWMGAAITALFTSGIMAMNHLQVTYYLFLIIGLMAVSYAIFWIKKGEIKRLLLAATFSLLAVATGVLSNAVQLFTTYDYAKESIRGGSVLAESRVAAADGSKRGSSNAIGLDSAYAMDYSMSIPEPLVLAVPRLFGGASGDPLPEDGQLYEVYNQYPGLAQQFPASAYWGGIGGTSGPPYSGAIICALAIFGMFVIDNKYKWWMMAAVLLACVLAWGGYFFSFNGFLLKHLPFYNKFRAPSMAIVIAQLILPIMAVLTVDKLSNSAFDISKNSKKLKNGLYAVGGFILLLFVFYFTASYTSPQEAGIMKQINNIPDAQTKEVYKSAFTALAADRKTVAIGDIGRTVGFILVAATFLFAMLKNWIKPLTAGIAITVLVFIDLITIDLKYLNSDMFVEKTEYEGKDVPAPELLPTSSNLFIKKDTGVYRVFDARQTKVVDGQQRRVDPYSDASQAYYHNLVVGYHAAKLSIYQDLIENQISKNNPAVFDMLNTKYFIVNSQNGGDSVVLNTQALGPAWFVKGIRYVNSPRAEMDALDNLNVKDSAVVQEKFKDQVTTPVWDSSASISVTNYDNDEIEYAVNTNSNQFLVLSEVYYSRGWKAYADGKELPIVKTNYVLRGISLPAGTKKLELKFEPAAYKLGYTVTSIMQIIILLLLAAGLFETYRNYRKKEG